MLPEDLLNFVEIIVENIGLGPAYEVKFEIQPDFRYGLKQGYFSEIGFIKKGNNYFPPGQRRKFVLRSMSIDYGDDKDLYSEIAVNYSDSLNNKYTDIYVIDLSEFHGLNQLGKPPLYEIAESLKKIEKFIQVFKQNENS